MCNKIMHTQAKIKSDDELILNINSQMVSNFTPEKTQTHTPTRNAPTLVHAPKHNLTHSHTYTSCAKYVLFPPVSNPFKAPVKLHHFPVRRKMKGKVFPCKHSMLRFHFLPQK